MLKKYAYRVLRFLMKDYVKWRFNLEAEICRVEGPCLIVSNHVTNWDPLLLALSFEKEPLSFVASEHIFRWGFLAKIITSLIDLIPRSKAGSAANTVMMCLRRLKAGGRVCLFGEGDVCWDGVSQGVFPATGKLARMSGASLVTYRLEGGYLSLPRWSKTIRRGKMYGRVVGIYSPEELKSMKPEEITELIDRDLYENAWQRQEKEAVIYKSGNTAQGIETALFLCPKCRSIGTIRGEGQHIRCSCGLEIRYTERGWLEPGEPFRSMEDWDRWQHEQLREMDFQEGEVFSDENIRLSIIKDEHKQELLYAGRLSQEKDCLSIGGRRFPMGEISNMAMVQSYMILFTMGEEYYELRSDKHCCMRKYMAMWKNYKEA